MIHAIPPITDPMGKSWRQPDLTDLNVQGTHALLSRVEFDGLPEYSSSYPTGVYPGKAWKCHWRGADRWFLRWFGIVPGNDKVCSNHQLEILIVGGFAQ